MTRQDKLIEQLKWREAECLGIARHNREIAEFRSGNECIEEAKYFEGKAEAYRYVRRLLEEFDMDEEL